MQVRVNVVQVGRPEHHTTFLAEREELACLCPNSAIRLIGGKEDEISGKWIVSTVNAEFRLVEQVPGEVSTGALQTIGITVEPTENSHYPKNPA